MPAPLKSSRRHRQRPPGGWVSGPRESTAWRAGVAGTIIVHLLLIWLAPHLGGSLMHSSEFVRSADPILTPQFEIEIADLPPLPPDTYVDANPDAPDNEPDETDKFSDRNQQLAQEVAAEELGDMPSTVGEDDIESTSIVSGTMRLHRRPSR